MPKRSKRQDAGYSNATKKIISNEVEEWKQENFKISIEVENLKNEILSHKTKNSKLNDDLKSANSLLRSEIVEKHWIARQIKVCESNVIVLRYKITSEKLKNVVMRREKPTSNTNNVQLHSGRMFTSLKTHSCRMKRVDAIVKFAADTSLDGSHEPIMKYMLTHTSKADGTSFTKLSEFDSYVFKYRFSLSDSKIKDMSSFFNAKLGYSVISSRYSIAKMENKYDKTDFYEILENEIIVAGKKKVTAIIRAINVVELLSHRLSTLSNAGRLIFRNGQQIVCVVSGDKGGALTKIVIAIENVEHANSPNNLLLLACYEGNDNYEELSDKLMNVFQQINQLSSITYYHGNTLVQKPIQVKLTGDHKFVSSVFGHGGQSCSFPCTTCDTTITTHGSNVDTIGNFDFKKLSATRTNASLVEDSKNSVKGMKEDKPPLMNVEPEDVVPATVHIVSGLFENYVMDPIIGKCNFIDQKCVQVQALKDQKKQINWLRKQEKQEEKGLSNLNQYIENCQNIHNALTNYRPPKKERPCASNFCIIESEEKKKNSRMVEWVQCDQCHKDYHMYCSLIVSEDHKVYIQHAKRKFKCCNCYNFQKSQLIDTVAIMMKNFESERLKMEASLHETVSKKRELESLVLKSEGPHRQALEMVLREIGADTRIWFQQMVGNQIRKCLKTENIDKILNIFPPSEFVIKMRPVMLHLGNLMSLSGKENFDIEEMEMLEEEIDKFVEALKESQPNSTVIPKLHNMVVHVPAYVRKFETWGGCCSEQATEHVHVVVKKVNNDFNSVRDVKLRAELLIKRLSQINLLFDMGEK